MLCILEISKRVFGRKMLTGWYYWKIDFSSQQSVLEKQPNSMEVRHDDGRD
jgi:hypothetical protein